MIDERAPLLELRGLTKAFAGHRVLSDVSFQVAAGEFVALLGANGAGKSTLIKILDGVYQQDGGEIRVAGQKVRDGGRGDTALIGVVHQDLGLVNTLSVADNLRLGMRPHYLARPLLNLAAERRSGEEALRMVGLDGLDPYARVGSLGLGVKTLLAVAKQLFRGARVVVADETTSAMSSAESRWFISKLRSHSASGAAVLMVSHKLTEVIEAADRHIVLRDGHLVAQVPRAEATHDRLAELITGTKPGPKPQESVAVVDGEELAVAEDAVVGPVGPFSLSVRAGHVTAVTGLTSSGLYDVAMVMAGLTEVESGQLRRKAGVRTAFVPPDRDSQGVVRDMTVRENLTLGVSRRWARALGLLRLSAERTDAQALLTQLKVVPTGLTRRQGTLSGGNQQKVLIGRALLREPHLLVLCEPTRGVDVATRAQIHQTILDARQSGVAVLLVSTDSEEVVSLADTVHVMRDGLIGDVIAARDVDPAGLEVLL